MVVGCYCAQNRLAYGWGVLYWTYGLRGVVYVLHEGFGLLWRTCLLQGIKWLLFCLV